MRATFGGSWMKSQAASKRKALSRPPFRRVLAIGAIVGGGAGGLFALAITLPDAIQQSLAYPYLHGQSFSLVLFAFIVSVPIGLGIGVLGACAGGFLLFGGSQLGLPDRIQRLIAVVGVGVVGFLAAAVVGPIFLHLSVILFSSIVAIVAAAAFGGADAAWRRRRRAADL